MLRNSQPYEGEILKYFEAHQNVASSFIFVLQRLYHLKWQSTLLIQPNCSVLSQSPIYQNEQKNKQKQIPFLHVLFTKDVF